MFVLPKKIFNSCSRLLQLAMQLWAPFLVFLNVHKTHGFVTYHVFGLVLWLERDRGIDTHPNGLLFCFPGNPVRHF